MTWALRLTPVPSSSRIKKIKRFKWDHWAFKRMVYSDKARKQGQIHPGAAPKPSSWQEYGRWAFRLWSQTQLGSTPDIPTDKLCGRVLVSISSLGSVLLLYQGDALLPTPGQPPQWGCQRTSDEVSIGFLSSGSPIKCWQEPTEVQWTHIWVELIPVLKRASKESDMTERLWASLVAQTVKHLPAMRETWARSLGQEDTLEKEMETHSSTPAWKTPWMEEPGRLQSMGSQRVRKDWVTSLSLVPGLEVRKCQPRVSGTEWSLEGRNRLQPSDRCQGLCSTRMDSEAIRPRSSRVGLSVCLRASRAGSDFLVTDCLPIAFPVQRRIPRSPQPHACPLQPPKMLNFLLIL